MMRQPDFPLLAELPDGERRALLAAGERHRYQRREVVFHEGDLGDCLHLIVSGRVAVRVATPLGDIATLSVLGPGDTFGELALLDPESRRTATIVALELTETWTLRRATLWALRGHHPEIDQFLANTLAAHVRRLSALVLDALYLPVERRIARRLASLLPLYLDGTTQTQLALTQEDVASLAGTSRATANRVLGSLAAGGVLRLARGRITVLDPERLAKAAR